MSAQLVAALGRREFGSPVISTWTEPLRPPQQLCVRDSDRPENLGLGQWRTSLQRRDALGVCWRFKFGLEKIEVRRVFAEASPLKAALKLFPWAKVSFRLQHLQGLQGPSPLRRVSDSWTPTVGENGDFKIFGVRLVLLQAFRGSSFSASEAQLSCAEPTSVIVAWLHRLDSACHAVRVRAKSSSYVEAGKAALGENRGEAPLRRS